MDPPTVGVEEEFLLVDPGTAVPAPMNVEVAHTATDVGLELGLELSRCQIETRTRVHTDSAKLLRELRDLRRTSAACAEKNGTRMLAAALPPTVPVPLSVTDTPRYRRIADGFGVLAQEQGLCGCHVHVGVPDRAVAVEVSNFLRARLPLFLALTANSAIYRGADTGFASWRNIQWRRWPSAGPPPHFTSVDHYDTLVQTMLSSGVILDPAMVYWDIRPSHTYPTVEIRISDVPATADETILLATLIRAAVMTARTASADGPAAPPVAPELLHAAYWRAAHTGVSGNLLDPTDGRIAPARTLFVEFVDDIGPALDRLGDHRLVIDSLATIFARGNGAVRQRCSFGRRQRAEDVVSALAEATVENCQ
ncbi:glutamate--cysteine ligase [Nocardia transvalensis]|nr:glutamate--cysteine ligase [Nocardia transvalensis]